MKRFWDWLVETTGDWIDNLWCPSHEDFGSYRFGWRRIFPWAVPWQDVSLMVKVEPGATPADVMRDIHDYLSGKGYYEWEHLACCNGVIEVEVRLKSWHPPLAYTIAKAQVGHVKGVSKVT